MGADVALLILGWAAAASSASVFVPQLIRIWRARVSAGVSLLLWQLSVVTSIGWTMHGVRLLKANMVVPNIMCIIVSVLVLGLIWRDRRLDWWKVFPPAVAVGLVAGGCDWFVPGTVFGLIMVVPALVGLVFQARDLIRNLDIRGVSVTFLLVNLLVQVLWVTWSVFAHDPSITWCGTLTGLAIVVNLILYVARRASWIVPQPRSR